MAADAHHVFDLADDEDEEHAAEVIVPAPADGDSEPVAQTELNIAVAEQGDVRTVATRVTKASRAAKKSSAKPRAAKPPIDADSEPAVLTQLLTMWQRLKPFATRQERDRAVIQLLAFLKDDRPAEYPSDRELLEVCDYMITTIDEGEGNERLDKLRAIPVFCGRIIRCTKEIRFQKANGVPAETLAHAIENVLCGKPKAWNSRP
jgi:hypothetical protein